MSPDCPKCRCSECHCCKECGEYPCECNAQLTPAELAALKEICPEMVLFDELMTTYYASNGKIESIARLLLTQFSKIAELEKELDDLNNEMGGNI